ncbi:hypothetical protein Tco_0859065 [Tanacetum coccineum]|uniref:Uncharacterized protein n=1 Tax=Tanacetum coccineum TaxID=301880 RepID=A0ABQ5BBX1_9ASTR
MNRLMSCECEYSEKGEDVSLGDDIVLWDDSSIVDGGLVGAFRGLGDCGVDIGEGVLVMNEGEGVIKSTKFKCLVLILVILLMTFLNGEFEEDIVVGERG